MTASMLGKAREVLKASEDGLIDLRRRLHRRPSRSGEEGPTAEVIRRELATLEPDQVWTGLGGEGLAVSFRGRREGPTVLLRCELDALPMTEELEIPHASVVEGAAHKCGHDGHMAQLVGVARVLAELPPERGRVVLLFQPAEESGAGARAVVEDPRFPEIRPDRAFALHNAPGLPRGQVAFKGGAFAAASAALCIELEGESSHASQPHLGRDPTLATVHLIQAFPALPHWVLPTGRFADVTLTSAEIGGPGLGIAPGEGAVAGTFRAAQDEDLERLLQRAEELAEQIAAAHQLGVSTSREEEFPAARNEDARSLELLGSVCDELGVTRCELGTPFPWSEDFGHLLAESPGALFALGSGEDQASLHSPDYDYPDELIVEGSLVLFGIAAASLD